MNKPLPRYYDKALFLNNSKQPYIHPCIDKAGVVTAYFVFKPLADRKSVDDAWELYRKK
jgi:hypothetical protein